METKILDRTIFFAIESSHFAMVNIFLDSNRVKELDRVVIVSVDKLSSPVNIKRYSKAKVKQFEFLGVKDGAATHHYFLRVERNGVSTAFNAVGKAVEPLKYNNRENVI